MTTALRVVVARWPAAEVPERLGACDALVFVASLHGHAARQRAAEAVLSAPERVRYEAYGNPVVARRFAIGRAALREVVGAALDVAPSDVPLRDGAHGKPVLGRAAARSLWFSVAHCEELLLIALSRCSDVGVDVERVRAIEHWERVAERVLDPFELRQLRHDVAAGEDAGVAFLGHWCRVEAELKAIGCGIAGLEAHRAGRRPLGLRVADLRALPVPRELMTGDVRYRAAIALCAPGLDGARQANLSTSHLPIATRSSAGPTTPQ